MYRSRNQSQEAAQIIFEAEVLAAVVATVLWKSVLKDVRTLLFVDNEGAKFALLKGYNDNSVVDRLAEVFVECESETHIYLWISRVPSASNVADEPSRGIVSHLINKGFTEVSCEAGDVLQSILGRI